MARTPPAGASLPAPPQGTPPTPPSVPNAAFLPCSPSNSCDSHPRTVRNSPFVTPNKTISRSSRALRRHDTLLHLSPAFPEAEELDASPPAVSLGSKLHIDDVSPVLIKPASLQSACLGSPTTPENNTPFDFPTDEGLALLQHLRLALQPAGLEHAKQQVLKLLDNERPGISIPDFARVISLCPGCTLMMASDLIAAHNCSEPPIHRMRKKARVGVRDRPSTPTKVKGKRRAKSSTSASSDGEN
ncbi:hypothetical protein BC834DRAFT_974117 [Gloeopeniophorella convolvens]|nr:hypothetical protein BC834DRAFT_974117 [Gloeopeniophorella convolvens]